MLISGVPLIVVSRQLGHADVTITGRIYAHLVSDDALDGALAVFDDPLDVATDVSAEHPPELVAD